MMTTFTTGILCALFGQFDGGLGGEYVDASFGFSVKPPKGWSVIGERSANLRDTLLLRMIDTKPGDAPPDIQVRLIRAPRGASMDQVFKDAQAAAQKEFGKFGAVSITGSSARRIAGQPGGRMSMSFNISKRPVIRLQAFIQARTDPKAKAQRFYVLVYTGAAETKSQAERAFDSVVGSFKLLQSERSDAEIKEALGRGKVWMDSLKGVRLADKRMPPQYYKVYLNDREAGCLAVIEEPAIVNRAEGVRVIERGWTFPASGEAQHVTNSIFLSADMASEEWHNRTLTLVPPKAAIPAALDLSLQEGARLEDKLITSECYEYGMRPVNNEPIKVARDFYASRLLIRWLPRLVDLKKPALYAFTGFDYDRDGLVIRTLEVKGAGLGLGGAYQIRDREGLLGAASDMWFDSKGRLVKLSAGAFKLELSDESALRGRWESKARKAESDIAVLENEFQKSLTRFNPDRAGK